MKANLTKKLLLSTFIDLIKIDEIYDQENEVLKYVETYFKTINIPTVRDAFNNIIAYLPGQGDPILLNTHLDIPENVPNLGYEIQGDVVRATGKSILGADPKSGLAVLLELARHIVSNNIQTQPIEFVFTRGEEAGLYGALNLDYSLLKSKIGLIIDEDGPCTNVVIRAPSFYRLDVTMFGKTVHSRDWAEGANAIAAISEAISRIKQGEIVKGVSCNVGLLQGGTARNSVSGEASFKAEMRSFDTQKMLKAAKRVEKMLNLVAAKHNVKVDIDSELEFEGYHLKKDHYLFKRLQSTFAKMGLKETYYETFGGSDANVINAHDIKCVPIGSGYYLAHQYTEYINLQEMKDLMFFLLEFAKTE